MKQWIRILAFVLAFVGVLLTGLGGMMDLVGANRLIVSKEHTFNDGLFLMIAAVFLLVAF
jgi:hypothetical protein